MNLAGVRDIQDELADLRRQEVAAKKPALIPFCAACYKERQRSYPEIGTNRTCDKHLVLLWQAVCRRQARRIAVLTAALEIIGAAEAAEMEDRVGVIVE